MMTDWEGGKPVKDDVYPNSEFRRNTYLGIVLWLQ